MAVTPNMISVSQFGIYSMKKNEDEEIDHSGVFLIGFEPASVLI